MLSEVNNGGDRCPPNGKTGSTLWYTTISPIREPASWPPMLRHVPDNDTPKARQDATSVHIPILHEERWDSAEDDALRTFYRDRSNLVLDSVFPHRVPHIVITPAEDNWDAQYTAWQNRVDIQWEGELVVPPLNLSHYLPPKMTSDPFLVPPNDITSTPASLPPRPVFSYSQFKRSIKSASVERRDSTQLVQTFQKAQFKAVFFAVSSLARSFRKRYDSYPNVLSKIDPIYVWSDPAEPILIASVGLLGTIIIDSTRPFALPHIIINSPPPQSPQLTENNIAPLIQDAAFGQLLTVQSHSVEVINSAEDLDNYYFSPSYPNPSDEISYDENFVDQMESDSESRPGTPAPETPIDEEGDYFCVGGRNDEHPKISGFNSPAQVAAEMETYKPQAFPRPPFFIDEDEDDLPSLDGW